jgi:hypothetical protein
MSLGDPDAKRLTRRRREQRADYVVEIPFGQPFAEFTCPECGGEFHATLHVPKDEPTFGNCSNWDCDAFLKFINEGTDARGSAGHNRSLGAFATDGGER